MVPDQRAWQAERPYRLDPRRGSKHPAVAKADPHRPQRPDARSLEQPASAPEDEGCRRQAGDGDAARLVLRHLEIRPHRPRSSGSMPSKRAPTRGCPNGRAAGSSASTARSLRRSWVRRSPTAACASATATSCACARSYGSARRSGSSRRAQGPSADWCRPRDSELSLSLTTSQATLGSPRLRS